MSEFLVKCPHLLSNYSLFVFSLYHCRKEKDLEAGLDTEDNSVLHGPDISKGKILFSQNTAFSPLPSKMKVNTRPSLIESNP